MFDNNKYTIYLFDTAGRYYERLLLSYLIMIYFSKDKPLWKIFQDFAYLNFQLTKNHTIFIQSPYKLLPRGHKYLSTRSRSYDFFFQNHGKF